MEKRILVLTNHFYPEYFKINDVVDWLVEDKCHICVITGNPNYPKGKIFTGFSISGSKEIKSKLETIYRLPLVSRGSGKKWRLFLNYSSYFFSLSIFIFWIIIFHKKYDVVLIHHTSPPFLFFPAYLYKKLRKSKVFLWELDIWPQTLKATGTLNSKIILNILEQIFRWFYKGFDLILYGSKFYEKIILNRVEPKILGYFPNWADSIFETMGVTKNKLKQNQKIIISYTGNIGESQDLESLVIAVSYVKKKNFEIRLIGDGRNKSALIKLVNKKGLNDVIKFYDSVNTNELIKYFKKSHFLYLSLKNNFLFNNTTPAKFQTYLATGIPVIGFISGEANDLINKYYLGYSCESNQINKLTNVFNKLTNLDDNQYQKMKDNCLSYYNTMYHSKMRKKEIKLLFKKN